MRTEHTLYVLRNIICNYDHSILVKIQASLKINTKYNKEKFHFFFYVGLVDFTQFITEASDH